MPFIDRDGARLYWRADGHPANPPLLLGNSLGTDQSLWDCLIPQLTASFYVIRMDQRGHGASPLTKAAAHSKWSIALLADDMLEVADAAGVNRFHYAGISIGGMIGIWLGAHAGERIRGLLLSNTAARLPRDAWPSRIAAVRRGGMEALVDSTLGRWFTAEYAEMNDTVLAKLRQSFLLTNPVAYAGAGEALHEMDLRPELTQIRAPATIIAGLHDTSTPPELGQQIAAAIEGSRCVNLPVAHIPHFESSTLFLAEVDALLARS